MKILFKKVILIIFLIISIYTANTNSASAYTDEGVVLWASGSNVVGRTYSAITNTLGGPYTAVVGVGAKFIVIKSSPTKKEFVMGIQDTSGTLRAYHSSDGQTWAYDWSATVGDGNVARFDVEYEKLTGRAMIVYRGRILSNRTTFYYRIWNGSSWTTQSEMRATSASYAGNIVGVSLASNPNSNQLGLIYLDDKYYAVAASWSGLAWSFAPSAVTTNSSRYSGFSGTFPPVINVSVEFESQSGDMLAVAGQNNSDHMHYITRSAAGTWSSVQIYSSLTGYGDYSKLRASPTTNEIALTSCMMEPNSARYLCEFSIWDGSSFASPATDLNSGQIRDGDIPTDIFWVTDGTNRAAVAIYDNDTTEGLDWYMSLNGGDFMAMPAYTGIPTISNHEGQIESTGVIGDPSKAYVVISDESNNVYLKQAIFNGTTINWSSTNNIDTPEVTQGSYPVSSSNFGRLGFSLQHAPSTLVVEATPANTRRLIGAGSTSYISGSDCTDETTCSGFALEAKGKDNIGVSSITFSNTGTINLSYTSSWQLGIDDDGNPNNGVLRTINGYVSGNSIVFDISPALTVNKNQKIYLFPKATFGTDPYPNAGDTITLTVSSTYDITIYSPLNADSVLVDAPTIYGVIVPSVSGYKNITETGLSNIDNTTCVDCGARIGAGSYAQTIEISGAGFGDTKGSLTIAGTAASTEISSANIVSWASNKIVFKLDTQTTGNSDNDFGTNYGGPKSLIVTTPNGSKSDGLDFYLFPQIIGVTTSVNTGTNAAKEYSAEDTDGVITLLGTRFGANSAAGNVQILGCSNTTCISPSDSVYIQSWTNTSIVARVPTTIADNKYSGDVTVIRNYPVDSVSATVKYGSQLSIRPRLRSVSPTTLGGGDEITLSGDHLCPSGVCPSGVVGVDSNLNSSPQFSTTDRVVVGGAIADYFNSWNHSTIITKVPNNATLGSTTASVTAGTYSAGSKPVLIKITAIPGTPSNIKQFSGSDTGTLIPTGSYISTSTITFGAIISSTSSMASQMRLNIEVSPVGTPFSCGTGSCLSALTGGWVINKTSADCSLAANSCFVTTNLSSGPYHFRARTELVVSGTTYYSNWISYPDAITNLESEADFWIDSEAAVIIGLTHGTPGTNSVTITWDTNEKTDTLLQINKTGVFTDDCSLANGCNGISSTLTTSHSVSLKNLISNTTYYYRVRARDAALNTIWSPIKQFVTLAVDKPAKTLFFHAISSGKTTSENNSTSSIFMIDIPEQGVDFKSIFVDIRGNYYTYGIETTSKVTIKINGEPAVAYNLPGNSSIVSPWRIYHRVKNLNLNGVQNSITITAGPDTYISSLSADVVVSYLYTP